MQPYESVQKIETNNPDQLMALFGTHDRHVRIIEPDVQCIMNVVFRKLQVA